MVQLLCAQVIHGSQKLIKQCNNLLFTELDSFPLMCLYQFTQRRRTIPKVCDEIEAIVVLNDVMVLLQGVMVVLLVKLRRLF